MPILIPQQQPRNQAVRSLTESLIARQPSRVYSHGAGIASALAPMIGAGMEAYTGRQAEQQAEEEKSQLARLVRQAYESMSDRPAPGSSQVAGGPPGTGSPPLSERERRIGALIPALSKINPELALQVLTKEAFAEPKEKTAEFKTFYGPEGERRDVRRGSPEAAALVEQGFVSTPPDKKSEADLKYVKDVGMVDFKDPDNPRVVMAAPPEVSGSGAPKFSDVSSMRKEFSTASKDFVETKRAYDKIRGASDNAAGDLALMFGYMKALDPTSVVRESEFATVANTGSLGQRLQAGVARVLSGERLTQAQRDQFKNEAKQAVVAQVPGQRQRMQDYTAIAKRWNVRPDDVVRDYTKGLGENVEDVAPEGQPGTLGAPGPAPAISSAQPQKDDGGALASEHPEGTIATAPTGEQLIVRGGAWMPL